MLKSQSDDWETPKELLQSLEQEFGSLFDPCPVQHEFDGLNIEWKSPAFVNPPYSEWPKWVKKGIAENLKGKTIIFLLPARTDTRTFHEYIYHKAEIRFLKGRLKFSLNGKRSSAPFPSMLVIFHSVISVISINRGVDHSEIDLIGKRVRHKCDDPNCPLVGTVVRVYDLRGIKVRTLSREMSSDKWVEVRWDAFHGEKSSIPEGYTQSVPIERVEVI